MTAPAPDMTPVPDPAARGPAPSRSASVALMVLGVLLFPGGLLAMALLFALAFTSRDELGWYGLAIVALAWFIPGPMFRLAKACYLRGKRGLAVDARELLRRDPRPPVLYLRAFGDDPEAAGKVESTSDPGAWGILELFMRTEEECLASALAALGPVVAVGRPGEKLPYLGAARLYLDDAEWQQTVLSLMKRARCVVLRPAGTQGFRWEIAQVATVLRPEQVVILVSMAPAAYAAFREEAAKHFPRGLPEYAGSGKWLASTDRLGSVRGLVYFAADWSPRFVNLAGVSSARYQVELSLLGKRRLPLALRWALRPVFEQVGVPWTTLPMAPFNWAYAVTVLLTLAVIALSALYAR